MPKCVTFLNDLRLAPLLPPVLVLEHCLDLSLQFKQELLLLLVTEIVIKANACVNGKCLRLPHNLYHTDRGAQTIS